ncbi:MAG: TetR/AcrR family transcriptional regulator [Desulfotomaculaceae bacterium]|nr:TetR/AcrR family transcriptional regulator [Desulfotomaculaceae bacterium]
MNKELKKDFIADVALTCFLSSGYAGASVDDIVRAAGISKGGLYWHFKSKEDIFLYLIEKWITGYERELVSRFSGQGSAGNKLGRFVEYYLETADVAVITLIKEFLMQAKDEAILNKLQDLIEHSKTLSLIENVILEAVHKGENKPLDVEAAAYAFLGLFEGIRSLWFISKQDKSLLERLARTGLNIYLDGVLKNSDNTFIPSN